MNDLITHRIKFLGNCSVDAWRRQLPESSVWGDCHYLFDPDERDYDWLVVYNDMPRRHQEEFLACPRERTLLVTMEPPSIKCYGYHYTHQFGLVLTTQPTRALPHPGRIFSQCALQWFYGYGGERPLDYCELRDHPPLNKNRLLSTVCSSKQQRHTLHHRRYAFTQELKAKFPEMEIFGHGVRDMEDKAEALADYRYHLAIENYIGKHHWTEKLADVFLGCALPFYCGCPDAAEYFPQESFIPLDMNDVEGAAEIIQRAIRNGEYERRLPHILEARRRILEDYNMFAVLSRIVATHDKGGPVTDSRSKILSRRLLRKRKPLVAVSDMFEKNALRLRQIFRSDEV